MQVTWRDSPREKAGPPPWHRARDLATALKSQGEGAKGRRWIIPDPPPFSPQQRRLFCYEQTPKDSGWVWLPTDRSAAGRNLLENARGERDVMLESRRSEM